MGASAYCCLDNFLIGNNENEFKSEIMSLFRPRNKVISSILPDEFPAEMFKYIKILEEYPNYKILYYEEDVDIIKDRLNVLGYNLETAKSGFDAWIEAEKHNTLFREKLFKDKGSNTSSHFEQIYKMISELTAEKWIENLQEIYFSGVIPYFESSTGGLNKDTAKGYMLSINWFGYPGDGFLVPLRLVIEALENKHKLIYDISELIWENYLDYDQDFIQDSMGISISGVPNNAKIIILTEGITDARILTEVFELRYPYLKDNYSILDFESVNFSGGVGNLANAVKAFAGTGIVNNVIALFDNDTAAKDACKNINVEDLPSNIVIRYLPELELLRNYPTIGPSGLVTLDVNGMAASIELYLGEDVLRIDGNDLIPIQWKGYNKNLEQYQGEVLEKKKLQERFEEKLKRAKRGERVNWQDLDAVFKVIFSSFSEKTKNDICKKASESYLN